MNPPSLSVHPSVARIRRLILGGLLFLTPLWSAAQSPDLPAVSMALSPDEVGVGSSSELTITIDNAVNSDALGNIEFTLPLPEGVRVSGPVTECGGTIAVEGDGSLLRVSGGEVPASGSCEIRAIVTPSEAGPHDLSITDFSSDAGLSSVAGVTLLTPETPALGFSKRFVPDLVPLGGRSTLVYTIENQGTEDILNLSVSDLFPSGIAIATPPAVSTSCPGISITAINGTQAIEVSPEDPIPLPAGETCTLTLEVVGVTPGIHLSLSENLTARGATSNDVVSGGRAAAQLEVIDPASILDVTFTKEFLDNPIAPGAKGRLEFSITNNSTTDSITNLEFTDDLEATLSGLVATEIPTRGGRLLNANFDGATGGPVIGLEWEYLDRIENENGANQGYPTDQSGNAWNSVDFDVATSTIGPWESELVPIQAGTIDAFPGAPDLLLGIDAAPNGQNLVTTYLFRNTFELTAEEVAEPEWILEYLVDDGGIVYINGTEVFRTPSMPAGAVTTTTLSGLGNEATFSAVGVNLNGVLVEGINSIAVEVHQNTLESSDVGFQLQLVPGSQAPTGGFTYVDDPFQDQEDPDYSSGQLDPVGGFTGGALQVQTGGQGFFASFFSPQSSGGWTRDFTLEEAAVATINLRYRINLAGDFDNGEYGEAVLTVNGTRLGDGPGNSLLRFDGTSDNQNAQDSGWRVASVDVSLGAGTHTLVFGAYTNRSTSASEIVQAWFDDITIDVPEINIEPCGPGSSISGTDLLSIAGGTLLPGETCAFSVEVSVPVDARFGPHLNVTSRLTADVGGVARVALPATDTLSVEPIPPTLAASFEPSAIPGSGTSILAFTIDNRASALAAGDLNFSATLPDGLSLVTPLNVATTCPDGEVLTGPEAGQIGLSGGSVPAGETCTVTFEVTSAVPGNYLTTTGVLSTSLGQSPATSATLAVLPPPRFTQSFAPPNPNAGQAATLTYTIDNSTSSLDALNVSFSNSLPDGLVLANPINYSSTCLNGSVSGGPGAPSFSFSGGTVPAGTVCTVRVNVVSLEGGTYQNTTGELTSSLGNSGAASDTLVVTPIVSVSLTQTASAQPVVAGSGSNNLVYTLTASNSGPSTATGLTITEALTLPAGVVVESIVPQEGSYEDNTWNLGTLASGATASLTVSLTAGPTATAGANVISSSATLASVNETNSSELTTATVSTSIITRVDLQVTNTASADPVIAGSGAENLNYLVTVTNHGPSFATGVAIRDTLTLPPGVILSSVDAGAGTSLAEDLWTVGDLPVGTTVILRLLLTAGPSAAEGADTITNEASVVSLEQTDVNPQNNSIIASTSVRRETDLTLAVTESRDPVLAGFDLPGNLIHTVLVTNNGPSDASGVATGLERNLPAGVTVTAGNQSDWIIGDLPRGESRTFQIIYSVPAAVPGGAGSITTSAALAPGNEPRINPADDLASEATSVVSPSSVTATAGEMTLDFQTALFKQTVTITNNNPLGLPAFRVLINGLPDGVTVYNAQGQSDGRSFLLYNQTLAAGESVDLVVEYFQADASGGFEADFEIELLDAVEVATSGAGVQLERIDSLPNGDKLLEFLSTPGDSYTIQYSQNGENWFDVLPAVTAGANVTQWVDNGPPKTPSHPSTVNTRLYRVVHKSNAR